MGKLSQAGSAFAATLFLALPPTSFSQTPDPAGEMASRYAARMDRAVQAGASDPASGLTSLAGCVKAWNEATTGLATQMVTSFHNELVRGRVEAFAGKPLLPEWREPQIDQVMARLRSINATCQPLFAAAGESLYERPDVVQHVADIADTHRLMFASADRFSVAMINHFGAKGTVTPQFCQAGVRLSVAMAGILSHTGDPSQHDTLGRLAEIGTRLCPQPAS
jgi:hypothetical protein